jgi:serine/threonine protein kinase
VGLLEYKKGDVIGNKYEVIDTLGKGGCGIVYHVYSRETGNVCALKTFLDKYLSEVSVRERFKKEAAVWVSLDKHPYIVTAHFVEEIAGRLYIGIEYVEPPAAGWNTLDDYLRYHQIDYVQGLKWAIQFCHGMEHAFNKGIKAHRDIKPANIMIESSKMVKISDFGLAGFIDARNDFNISASQNSVSGSYNQTMMNVGMGTPTHMPPEQFINAAGCDERSDIYSFGVVLYQIASGGNLPFYTDNHSQFWQILQYLHSEKETPRLESKLDGIIRRCMNKNPSGRYQKFEQLRNDLECLLKAESGEVIAVPCAFEITALELNNKGLSLNNIGRFEDAINCLDKAILFDPNLEIAWCNKGLALIDSGRPSEAVETLIKAIAINPRYPGSWCNLGLAYDKIGKSREAVQAYQKAAQLDPNSYEAFYNIGNCFFKINAFEDSLKYYDFTIEIFDVYAPAWSNKGKALLRLQKYNDALKCLNKALDINPMSFYAWYNKGLCQQELNDYDDSIYCFDKAIAINKASYALIAKGKSFVKINKYDEAMDCIQHVLDFEPNNLDALTYKISYLAEMGRLNDALAFAKTSLLLLPSAPYLTFLKATLEDNLGMKNEAIDSYGIFISIADDSLSEQLRMANGRLSFLFNEFNSNNRPPYLTLFDQLNDNISNKRAFEAAVGNFDQLTEKLEFPVAFNEKIYKKAHQSFMEMADKISCNSLSFQEFIKNFFRDMITEYGVNVKPYVVKFAKEYEAIYRK